MKLIFTFYFFRHFPTVYRAINNIYEDVLVNNRGELNQPLELMGDCRYDSPGYCAKYCTYTLMKTNGQVVAMKTLIRQKDVEKLALNECIQSLLAVGFSIDSIVTDASPAVICFMRNQYPFIKHGLDKWHLIKSFKKSLKVLKLLDVVGRASNHLWKCLELASNYQEFESYFNSLPEHLSNIHTSCITHGVLLREHAAITHDQRIQLTKLISSKRFTDKMKMAIGMPWTSMNENLHSVMLRFASKRLFFKGSYVARIKLSIVHYNESLSSQVANEYQVFSKAQKKMVSKRIKHNQNYNYLDLLRANLDLQ